MHYFLFGPYEKYLLNATRHNKYCIPPDIEECARIAAELSTDVPLISFLDWRQVKQKFSNRQRDLQEGTFPKKPKA